MRFFKHDIAAWMGGTEGLGHAEYRVYHMVLNLIYLHEEPIVLNTRGLAGICNMSPQEFGPALKHLIAKGKLKEVEGRLVNGRAQVELRSVLAKRQLASRGGVASGQVRRRSSKKTDKPLKTNEPDERSLHSTSKQVVEQSRVDKTREERAQTSKKKSSPRADAARRHGAREVPKEEPRFAQWWAAYPSRGRDRHKGSRHKAHLAYAAALKGSADPDVLLTAIKNRIGMDRDRVGTAFIPLAETWLNGKRWQAADEAQPELPDWAEAAGLSRSNTNE